MDCQIRHAPGHPSHDRIANAIIARHRNHPYRSLSLATAATGIRAYQDQMGAGKIILQLGS
jgi:hypothetical protein